MNTTTKTYKAMRQSILCRALDHVSLRSVSEPCRKAEGMVDAVIAANKELPNWRKVLRLVQVVLDAEAIKV